MKEKRNLLIMFSPFLLALASAFCRSVWLAFATVIAMFIVVAVVPFAHKRENLWLFILCAFCSIPINFFVLEKYTLWMLLMINSNNTVLKLLSLLEMTLICTSVEEVIIALIGRRIWKKQYAFQLPELDED